MRTRPHGGNLRAGAITLVSAAGRTRHRLLVRQVILQDDMFRACSFTSTLPFAVAAASISRVSFHAAAARSTYQNRPNPATPSLPPTP